MFGCPPAGQSRGIDGIDQLGWPGEIRKWHPPLYKVNTGDRERWIEAVCVTIYQ